MINQSKNRDGAPLPPGHSRVKLLLMFDLIGSDYINAKWAWLTILTSINILFTVILVVLVTPMVT